MSDIQIEKLDNQLNPFERHLDEHERTYYRVQYDKFNYMMMVGSPKGSSDREKDVMIFQDNGLAPATVMLLIDVCIWHWGIGRDFLVLLDRNKHNYHLSPFFPSAPKED